MPHNISEDRTRKELIDPQLEKAGWYLRDHSKVKTEIPVDGYDAEPWNGVTDYTLYRENGEVLAVVEAKKTAVDVRLAEAQLTYYVTEIEKHQSFRPFGFLANGLESCCTATYMAVVWCSSSRVISLSTTTTPTHSAFCAPCKVCSCRSTISKPLTCTSRRWICLARMRWNAGLRRRKWKKSLHLLYVCVLNSTIS